MIISFILGWSGLSIQAQVSSILAEQNISSRLYCLCRPIQGLLAALYIPMLIVLFPGMLSAHTIQPDTLLINPVFQYPLWLFPCAALLLLLALSAGIRICKKVRQGIWWFYIINWNILVKNKTAVSLRQQFFYTLHLPTQHFFPDPFYFFTGHFHHTAHFSGIPVHIHTHSSCLYRLISFTSVREPSSTMR